MSRTFSDYLNETKLTIPDKFIDVKTGETHIVSEKIREQIEYHSNNNTLIHFVFSALDDYLHPQAQAVQTKGSNEIMSELMEIKRLIQNGQFHSHGYVVSTNRKGPVNGKLDMEEVDDVLEAFGG